MIHKSIGYFYTKKAPLYGLHLYRSIINSFWGKPFCKMGSANGFAVSYGELTFWSILCPNREYPMDILVRRLRRCALLLNLL